MTSLEENYLGTRSINLTPCGAQGLKSGTDVKVHDREQTSSKSTPEDYDVAYPALPSVVSSSKSPVIAPIYRSKPAAVVTPTKALPRKRHNFDRRSLIAVNATARANRTLHDQKKLDEKKKADQDVMWDHVLKNHKLFDTKWCPEKDKLVYKKKDFMKQKTLTNIERLQQSGLFDIGNFPEFVGPNNPATKVLYKKKKARRTLQLHRVKRGKHISLKIIDLNRKLHAKRDAYRTPAMMKFHALRDAQDARDRTRDEKRKEDRDRKFERDLIKAFSNFTTAEDEAYSPQAYCRSSKSKSRSWVSRLHQRTIERKEEAYQRKQKYYNDACEKIEILMFEHPFDRDTVELIMEMSHSDIWPTATSRRAFTSGVATAPQSADYLADLMIRSMAAKIKDSMEGKEANRQLEMFIDNIVLMKNAKNWKYALLQLKFYFSAATGVSFTLLALEAIKSLWGDLAPQSEDAEQSDEANMSSFRSFVSGTFKAVTGDFARKVYKTIACLVSALMCFVSGTKFSLDRFNKWYKSFDTIGQWTDIWTCVADIVTLVVERGVALYKGDISILQVFNRPADSDYDLRYSKVVGNINLYESGQLDKAKMSDAEYMMMLIDLLKVTASLVQETTGADKRIFAQKHLELVKIHGRVMTTHLNPSMRISAFAFLLHGTTSVGKTVLMTTLINAIARATGIGHEKRMIASIDPNEKYDSVIQPYTTIVRADDMGQTKPQYDETDLCSLLLKHVNNEPRTALKADVDSKGKVLMCAKLFAGSTNVKNLNASVKSVEPGALLRRMQHFIEVKVKPEYRQPGSTMIDKTKLPEDPDKMVEAWDFTVEECLITPQKNAEGQSNFIWVPYSDDKGPLVDASLDRVIKFLIKRARVHYQQQDNLLKSLDVMYARELCPHDSYAQICSDCNEVNLQSADDEELHAEYGALRKVRNWSFSMCDGLPAHIKNSKWFQRPSSFLQALGLMDKFYDVCKPVQWLGGAALALSGVAAVVTPLISFFGVVSCLMLYANFAVNKAHGLSKRIAQRAVKPLKKTFEYKYQIAFGLGTVVAVYQVAKFVKPYVKMFMAGSVDLQASYREEQGVMLPKDKEVKQNAWHYPTVEPVKCAEALATTTSENMVKLLSRQIAYVELDPKEDGTCMNACCMFPIKGGTWLLPYHVVRKGYSTLKMIRSAGVINSNRTVHIAPGSWIRIGATDLAIISLPALGDVYDMTDYFPESQSDKVEEVVFVNKNVEGEVRIDRFAMAAAEVAVRDPSFDEWYKYAGWTYRTGVPTDRGICCSPLVSTGKRPYIMGFHSAGVDGTTLGKAHYVSRQQIVDAYNTMHKLNCQSMSNVEIHSSGTMLKDAKDHGFEVNGEVHPKCVFNFFDEPAVIDIYGTGRVPRRKNRSSVVKTVVSPHVEEIMGIPVQHGSPENYSHPWLPWRDYAVVVTKDAPPHSVYLELAAQDTARKIGKFIAGKPSVKNILVELCYDAAISGLDDCFGIDSIKLDTSMCYPYYHTKKKHFKREGEPVDGISDPIETDQKVLDDVYRMEDCLASGERIHVVATQYPKDEPTKLGKKKVRIFSGLPAAFLIVVRKYLLTAAKVIMENGLAFETAVGVNATSPEWTKIRGHIAKKSEKNCVNGDFANFDQRAYCLMILIAFKIIGMMYECAGASERHLTIIRGIATEIAFALYNFDGTFAQMFGGHISGNALTVIINGFLNMLYMRMAWYELIDRLSDVTKRESLRDALMKDDYITIDQWQEWLGAFVEHGAPDDFDKAISLITYGDDNAMSVDPRYTWFNHQTISFILGQYGVKYTMADKEAKSIPYIPITEVNFLKREFRWDDRLEEWMAPLDEKSLAKTLHCVLKSEALTIREQTKEALIAVNNEAFFHGREKFEQYHSGMLKVIEASEMGTMFLEGELCGYEKLELRYCQRYKKSKLAELFATVVQNSTQSPDTSTADSRELNLQSKAWDSLRGYGLAFLPATFDRAKHGQYTVDHEHEYTKNYRIGRGKVRTRDGHLSGWRTSVDCGDSLRIRRNEKAGYAGSDVLGRLLPQTSASGFGRLDAWKRDSLWHFSQPLGGVLEQQTEHQQDHCKQAVAVHNESEDHDQWKSVPLRKADGGLCTSTGVQYDRHYELAEQERHSAGLSTTALLHQPYYLTRWGDVATIHQSIQRNGYSGSELVRYGHSVHKRA